MPKVASKRKQSAQGTAGQSPSTASNSDAAPPFWNDRTDDMLIASRKTGLPWDDIAKAHFNPKSGNACRKRYERLLARKKAAEWDGARWDAVAAGYAAARKAMWTPLAGQLGERWQDVEAKVMERGLKAVLASQKDASEHQAAADDDDDSGLGPDMNAGGLDDMEILQDELRTDTLPPLYSVGRMASTFPVLAAPPNFMPSLPTLLPAPVQGWSLPEPRMHYDAATTTTTAVYRPGYTVPPIHLPPIQATFGPPGGYQESFPASAYDAPLHFASGYRSY